METNTNRAKICGVVVGKKCDYESFGETIYQVSVETERQSGAKDVVCLEIPERISEDIKKLNTGDTILANGHLRAYYRNYANGGRHEVSVFVTDYYIVTDESCKNEVSITGYICKQPVYRMTPLGREIGEAMVAVNRKYNKADYIPCIFWGRNARFVGNLAVGDLLSVKGRLQSRIYVKDIGNGKFEQRTVYELSASQISTLDADDGMKDIENYFMMKENENGEQQETYAGKESN